MKHDEQSASNVPYVWPPETTSSATVSFVTEFWKDKTDVEKKSRDWLVRIQDADGQGRFTIDVTDTDQLRRKWTKFLSRTHFELDTLSRAVKSQYQLLEYNSVYIAFLLDQITEQEFEAEASNFVIEPSWTDHSELANRIATIVNRTDINFTPSELTDLFHCTQEDILAAVDLLRSRDPNFSRVIGSD